jgi:hypothetical protein
MRVWASSLTGIISDLFIPWGRDPAIYWRTPPGICTWVSFLCDADRSVAHLDCLTCGRTNSSQACCLPALHKWVKNY